MLTTHITIYSLPTPINHPHCFPFRNPTSHQFKNGTQEIRSSKVKAKTPRTIQSSPGLRIGTKVQTTEISVSPRKGTNGTRIEIDADTSQDMVPK